MMLPVESQWEPPWPLPGTRPERLAVLWVVAASLSVIVDHTRTSELVVIAIQATVALGIQAYVIWRIAAGWHLLSTAGRVGTAASPAASRGNGFRLGRRARVWRTSVGHRGRG